MSLAEPAYEPLQVSIGVAAAAPATAAGVPPAAAAEEGESASDSEAEADALTGGRSSDGSIAARAAHASCQTYVNLVWAVVVLTLLTIIAALVHTGAGNKAWTGDHSSGSNSSGSIASSHSNSSVTSPPLAVIDGVGAPAGEAALAAYEYWRADANCNVALPSESSSTGKPACPLPPIDSEAVTHCPLAHDTRQQRQPTAPCTVGERSPGCMPGLEV
jgi:hypothetical protein